MVFSGKMGYAAFCVWISAVISIIFFLYKKKRLGLLEIKTIGLILSVFLAYIAFVAAIWGKVVKWDIERYLSVVYPLMMLGIFIVWDKLYAEFGSKKIKLFLVILTVCWLLLSYHKDRKKCDVLA